MDVRHFVASHYASHVRSFEISDAFQSLESGTGDSAFYDKFIANLCKTHLKSPQILAFLYAVAPPSIAPSIQHNLLEELGLDEAGIAHPDLLRRLAKDAGFTEEMREQLETAAQEELRYRCSEPLLYGTLKELGLAVMLEVTCFEWMLSRLAGRLGHALHKHRGLANKSLEWFFHHSAVDVRHAEEGLDAVVDYVEFYGFDETDLVSFVTLTFRENIFLKRYFGPITLPHQTQRLETSP